MDRNRYFQSSCVNDAFLWLVREISHHPDHIVSPRDQATKEVVCMHVEILDPCQRVVTNIHRKVSLRYGIGEWLWYERASNKLEELAAYSRVWTQMSDDHVTINSAYGYRIFGQHPGFGVNQWEYVRSELSSDINSRRAIIVFVLPFDMTAPTKDFLCTVSLQFFIRDHKLHLVTNMRSNDLIWGFTYDVFCFTLFQEKMMIELQEVFPDLAMGSYHHFTTSMHIYERHYPLVEKILAHPEQNPPVRMPRMRNLSELKTLQYNEETIRTLQNRPLKALTDEFCIFCQQILLGKGHSWDQ